MNSEPSKRRDFFKLAGGALGIAALSYYLGLTDRAKPESSDVSPEYADDDSAFPVFRGPYLQKDVNLAAFMFAANKDNLIDICDKTLNFPEPAAYKYVPITSKVLFIYADMLTSSLDERDSQVGMIPETEVSFWILTIAMQKTSNGYTPHHLAWYLPYLFVDESNAIATGREVYGFNKLAAEFTTLEDIQSPQFTASVLGFKQFDPEAVAQKEQLLELKLQNSSTESVHWADFSDGKNRLENLFLESIRPDLQKDIVEFVTKAITNNIPLVFQKQFRDAADTQFAVYKKSVQTHLRLKGFYDGGSFQQMPLLTINDLDSHPIRRKLGLQEQQQAVLGAWMKVDFILEHGVEL